MRKVDLIHHTADKGIHIQADSLEELFLGALEGMTMIQKHESYADADADDDKAVEEIRERIDLEAPDRTALLIDFLSDVHTLSDIYNAVFKSVEFKEFSEQKLKATVSGFRVETFDEDIKAVTHSQAEIINRKDGILETVVVFNM